MTYFQLIELLHDILKHRSFENSASELDIIQNGHVVTYQSHEKGSVHSISLINVSTLDLICSIRCTAMDEDIHSFMFYDKSINEVNTRNIHSIDELITTTDDGTVNKISLDSTIDLREGITGNIFQLSTIYDDALLNAIAICSHFKNHGMANLNSMLFYTGNNEESILQTIIQDLIKIKQDITK